MMKEGKQSYRRATRALITERRARVAELYRCGHTQAKIAQQLDVSPFTISTDIGALIAEWKRKASIDIAAHFAIAAEKITRIEQEAWEAYRKSEQPRRSATAHRQVTPVVDEAGVPLRDGSGKPITVENSTSSATEDYPTTGEERFLARASWCVDEYIKLYGLAGRRIEKVEEQSNQPKTFEEFVAQEISKREAKQDNLATLKVARTAAPRDTKQIPLP